MMGWMAPLRHLSAKMLGVESPADGEPSMSEITTIGLDLAKHVFQVHGVDANGANCCAQATAACTGAGVLQPVAALPNWAGSVYDGTLLGAGVADTWP